MQLPPPERLARIALILAAIAAVVQVVVALSR
jgi:hypothetical protein